jgi:hypothetical protein
MNVVPCGQVAGAGTSTGCGSAGGFSGTPAFGGCVVVVVDSGAVVEVELGEVVCGTLDVDDATLVDVDGSGADVCGTVVSGADVTDPDVDVVDDGVDTALAEVAKVTATTTAQAGTAATNKRRNTPRRNRGDFGARVRA